MKLTKKQKAYAEYYINHPLISDAQIARDLDISTSQICKWRQDPEFKSELTRLLDEQWKDARVIGQQTMLNLASNGDYRAAEFLMKTNGVVAKEQVALDANVNTIRVTVIDEE